MRWVMVKLGLEVPSAQYDINTATNGADQLPWKNPYVSYQPFFTPKAEHRSTPFGLIDAISPFIDVSPPSKVGLLWYVIQRSSSASTTTVGVHAYVQTRLTVDGSEVMELVLFFFRRGTVAFSLT